MDSAPFSETSISQAHRSYNNLKRSLFVARVMVHGFTQEPKAGDWIFEHNLGYRERLISKIKKKRYLLYYLHVFWKEVLLFSETPTRNVNLSVSPAYANYA